MVSAALLRNIFFGVVEEKKYFCICGD